MVFKMNMVFINNSNNLVRPIRQVAVPVSTLLNVQNSVVKRYRGTFYFKNSNNNSGGGCSSCGH